jgi:hypothetical protein
MDRINHVKIVTPDPAAVEEFLTEILDLPEGWSLGECAPPPPDVVGPARNPDGSLDVEGVTSWRGLGTGGGVIVGSPESRQFQIFQADEPKIWAVAVGTRNVERAHERCIARGLPCTEVRASAWGREGGGVTYFFVEVGGIVWEVMRIEPTAPA